MKLTGEQEHAVDLCTDRSERIVCVTGGAGTGKTLVLGHAFRVCPQPVLCAPTGRAAKRIQELTGIQAQTIHRLLEFPSPDDPIEMSLKNKDNHVEIVNVPTDHEPRRNRANPIEFQTVFVDEASMLGKTLATQLLAAMPPGGCVRFFGDRNQLPPVEDGGSPFTDYMREFPSVTLTLNFRNDDEIISNALRILSGSIPLQNSRFRIVYADNPAQTLIALSDETSAFAQANNQIIMPQRKGRYGTSYVNTSLQLKYNPKGPMLRLRRFDATEAPLLVRPRDKFLWIKNDYNLKLFNGEIGQIEWVNMEDGALGLTTSDAHVAVPARVKTFSPYLQTNINYDPRKQIELGYAITTHKSQGSEFERVIYCISGSASFLLNRQNFYTAVTRAKKEVIVIADRKAMGRAMRKA